MVSRKNNILSNILWYLVFLHLSVSERKNKRKLDHSCKMGQYFWLITQYFSLIPHFVIGSFEEQYETSHTVHLLDESPSFLYLELQFECEITVRAYRPSS